MPAVIKNDRCRRKGTVLRLHDQVLGKGMTDPKRVIGSAGRPGSDEAVVALGNPLASLRNRPQPKPGRAGFEFCVVPQLVVGDGPQPATIAVELVRGRTRADLEAGVHLLVEVLQKR